MRVALLVNDITLKEKGVDMICPFCQQENQCKVNFNEACWCFELTIPPDMLLLLEKDDQGKSCVCSSCINQYKEGKELFIQALRQ